MPESMKDDHYGGVAGPFNVLNLRMDTLHRDVGDIKVAMRDLTAAITKLALIEERLSNNSNSLERAFRVIEQIDKRLIALETAAPGTRKDVGRVSKYIELVMQGAVIIIAGVVLKHAGVL